MKSNKSYMSFKTVRGALQAAKRALRVGLGERDLKRRIAARFRKIQDLNRDESKKLADDVLACVAIGG